MKAVKFLPHVLVLGLLLVLAASVGLVFAQAQAPAEETEQPYGEVSIDAAVASKFSYQGVLKENGSAVTGSRDMTFRLYSDDACTTQVGGAIAKSDVQVTNGLFSAELTVTHGDFNGQGLWLDVEVGGVKTSCQEILPVPYALSLRPGAVIRGTNTYAAFNNNYCGVHGSGTDYGVYGHSETGAALYGAGDVKQSREDDGLVKAAAYVYCNNMSSLIPFARSFNNVNQESFDYSPGGATGRCTIDFNFDISDRYWVATAVGNFGYGVTCELGSSNDTLECVRWRGSDGTGIDGDIMVLVY